MRATLASALLLLSATSLVHASGEEPQRYTYGTQLDIASVMSIKIDMTYRDSSGEVRQLAYRTLADACKNQN
ncbi:DUF2790 domain-containing protein [Pseudomonas knackmussii]|uniref:DUF2790 domain-containing protein n=1 Tax=Pseudomonas knackmussii TaxID=65741 RepID=A0ABY4KQY5_9PSED|nr:DUF2790 domain-containing protein [Pseudomonas knackmussii]UPQ82646.1 DUF2790 domain-containing protein [Pseudomonas knackmussii]